MTAPAVTASAGHHGHSSSRGDGTDALIVGHIARRVGERGDGTDGTDAPTVYHINSVTSCAKASHAVPSDEARSLDRHGGFSSGQQGGTLVFGGNDTRGARDDVPALLSHPSPRGDFESEAFVVPFDDVQLTHPENRTRCAPGDPLAATSGARPSVAIYSIVPEGGQGTDLRASAIDVAPAVTRTDTERSTDRGARVVTQASVRRLTPLECERLQGFPDGWTCLCGEGRRSGRYRTADCVCADGPRYAALGNAVAVPVVEWIARRLVEGDSR